jgi:hypothetical protein
MSPPFRDIPMRQRFLFPLLTIVFGLGLGLALAEGGLRLGGFSNPRTSQRDDFCGTIRRPGAEYLQTQEGAAHVRFNTAGFRDEDWSVEKPPNTFRIAVLGDSYVEAGQVAVGDRFTEVLERELDRSVAVDGKRVHVMSFGVAGFGTAQELMCLRHHAWRYAPDMVILAVTTGNDLRNNTKTLQNDDGRPYFNYVNGVLTLDTSFRQSPAHRISWQKNVAFMAIDRSRVAQIAYSFWQGRSSVVRRRLTEDAVQSSHPGDELGLDSWIYAEPTHPLHQEAWAITEGLFGLMSREVSQHGARFLVVTLSNGIQVHPDPSVRDAFMRRVRVGELFYPEGRIGASGQREGFTVVNLAPMLLEHAQKTGVILHGFGQALGFGHWNQKGHLEAGQRLAEAVRTHLSAPSNVNTRGMSERSK